MNTEPYSTKKNIFILFFLIFSSAAALLTAETYVLGGKEGWKDNVETTGLVKGKGRYGYESLELASNSSGRTQNTDLLLDFEGGAFTDKAGRYRIVENALFPSKRAVRGTGAALSRSRGSGIKLSGDGASFFGSAGQAGSFVIDFWICPAVIDNGETILNWRSSRKIAGALEYQVMSVYFYRNKLFCVFTNIFDGYLQNGGDVVIEGSSVLVPDRWSHHTIAFQEENGLLEYRVDGLLEYVQYITDTGTEGGSVNSAVIGVPAELEICGNYTGLIDDFRIMRSHVNIRKDIEAEQKAALARLRYEASGGRIESKPIMLQAGSTLNSISAETTVPPETAVQFYVRSGDNRFNWTKDFPAWRAIKPEEKIDGVTGTFFQVAAELFPDGAGKNTPSVTEIGLNYTPLPPPTPPLKVAASAGDGSVTLTWNRSVDESAGGYYIYYGTKPGEYLGRMAEEGVSPINAGSVTRYTVTGLKNGAIYYFALAAWSKADQNIRGGFSKEVYARPVVKQ
ncbi:MAG: hypothetical protein ACTTKL_01245 [Treponema sp.]